MWPLPETLRSAGVEIEVLKVPKRALLKIPVEVPGRISFEAGKERFVGLVCEFLYLYKALYLYECMFNEYVFSDWTRPIRR